MQKGKIIFLNGVSSSGKTTLAKTLLERLTEPYYYLSPDVLLCKGGIVPDKFATNDDDGFRFMRKSYSVYHHIIKAISDMGQNTIVDTLLLDRVPYESVSQEPLKNLDECVELLHDCPVLFVHVTCPIKELRRREKKRGDRPVGHGEKQLAVLVPQDTYDITVDTYNKTIEECADQVIASTEDMNKHTSFKTLWLQHKNQA